MISGFTLVLTKKANPPPPCLRLYTCDHYLELTSGSLRMLVEDEYVIPGVEVEAAKMMLLYMDNAADDENCPDGDDGRIVFELQTIISDIEDNDAQNEQNRPSVNASGSASMLKSLKMSVSDDANKSYDGSVDGKEESNKASMRRSRRTSALKESSRGDFTMELF